MGTLSDILGFEKFNLKDMWRKIKDDPERLLIGAVDPASTKMWNKVLGKDYEPIVDQMGGAYGGHTISAFGNTDGGVYGRARDAGIDVDAGAGMHDIAHTVAAIYGGQGLANIGGAANSNNLGVFSNGGQGGMGSVGGGNTGLLAESGGIGGGAGTGGAGFQMQMPSLGGQNRQQTQASALRGRSEDLEVERQRREREEEMKRKLLAAALRQSQPNQMYSPAAPV
jgi:hypothetical protein